MNNKNLSERDIYISFIESKFQKAIVAKVNAVMVLCDNLEQKIATRQTTHDNGCRVVWGNF